MKVTIKNIIFEGHITKYAFDFSITRLRKEQMKFDVFFVLRFGYGNLSGFYKTKGVWFYIDALRFDIKSYYNIFGFERKL